ncbi:hypothetical protein C8C99_4044 [Acidovorax sp. 107]|nr:hypothetical protein C8C99_4044 [Acidovorax sp. 107]
MIRRTLRLLSIQQTVTQLDSQLPGAAVAWYPFLADIRRSPREGTQAPDLYGQQLMPYACNGNVVLYKQTDVQDFIDAVRAADPGVKASRPPQFFVVDDHGHLQPWRSRNARPALTPTAPATLFRRAA